MAHIGFIKAMQEYGITLHPEEALNNLDALVLAVPHKAYLNGHLADWLSRIGRDGNKGGGILIDVKSAVDQEALSDTITYWSL